MIPIQIIERVKRGGWKWHGTDNVSYNKELGMWVATGGHQYRIEMFTWEQIALDPTFWQALGKALGWKEWKVATRRDEWIHNAHAFYDLILTGGDTDKFWKEIL